MMLSKAFKVVRKYSIHSKLDPRLPYGPNITVAQINLKNDKKSLHVLFGDNKTINYSAEFLRVESPSAEMIGFGNERKIVSGKRNVTITKVEPVGQYAIQLTFSDGHATGIYSYQFLRQLGEHKFSLMKRYINALKKKNKSRNPRS